MLYNRAYQRSNNLAPGGFGGQATEIRVYPAGGRCAASVSRTSGGSERHVDTAYTAGPRVGGACRPPPPLRASALTVAAAITPSCHLGAAAARRRRSGSSARPACGGDATHPIYDLTTKTGYISLPDGNTAFMWGYSAGFDDFQHPGPVLCVNEGDTVTVILHNTLAGAGLGRLPRPERRAGRRRAGRARARRPGPDHLADRHGRRRRRHHHLQLRRRPPGHLPLRVRAPTRRSRSGWVSSAR